MFDGNRITQKWDTASTFSLIVKDKILIDQTSLLYPKSQCLKFKCISLKSPSESIVKEDYSMESIYSHSFDKLSSLYENGLCSFTNSVDSDSRSLCQPPFYRNNNTYICEYCKGYPLYSTIENETNDCMV